MSTIKVDAIQDTSGNDQFTANAWVNFNGTGTVAIRADGNVSSITDNGTGDYTVNYSNNLPSINNSPVWTGQDNFANYPPDYSLRVVSASACQVYVRATGGSVVAQDPIINTMVAVS